MTYSAAFSDNPFWLVSTANLSSSFHRCYYSMNSTSTAQQPLFVFYSIQKSTRFRGFFASLFCPFRRRLRLLFENKFVIDYIFLLCEEFKKKSLIISIRQIYLKIFDTILNFTKKSLNLQTVLNLYNEASLMSFSFSGSKFMSRFHLSRSFLSCARLSFNAFFSPLNNLLIDLLSIFKNKQVFRYNFI